MHSERTRLKKLIALQKYFSIRKSPHKTRKTNFEKKKIKITKANFERKKEQEEFEKIHWEKGVRSVQH